MMYELRVQIGMIHCGGCITRIERIARQQGATSFQFDFATKIANLDFTGEAKVGEDICQAIQQAGYQAKSQSIRPYLDESE